MNLLQGGHEKTKYPEEFFFSSWLRSFLSPTSTKGATPRKDGCKKKHPIKGMLNDEILPSEE